MKKLLAMVLALVMTLSLAVSANAFTDDSKVNDSYAEAVAVLNGMGVFKGYEDGSFKPEGDITRAEVATIVYRIYTADVAKNDKSSLYATYNKFSDMAGASWAAGYIGYCANAELVKGYPDGTFKPSGKVTGYEVLAMILRAVGYDKNGEFSGADWALHVAQTAQQAGLLKNVKGVDLNAAASRELVAELLFRGIQASTVTYTPAFGYVTDKVIGAATSTIGVKNFKLDSKDTADKWGRPGTLWTYNTGDKKTTVLDKPDVTYTKAVAECDVAHDAGLTDDADYSLYVNGKLQATKYTVNLTDTKTKMGAQGRLVEVYDDTIVMIDTFLAKVTYVADMTFDPQGHLKTPATITLSVYDGSASSPVSYTLTDDETNYGYAKDEYVLLNAFTKNNSSTVSGDVILADNKPAKDVKYGEIVAKATSLDGAQSTIYWNAKQHSIEGTTYDDAYKFILDEAGHKDGKYTWFFDQYGNVIGSVEIAAATSYGVINSMWWSGNAADGTGVAKANVTYMDGTTAVLEVSTLIYDGAATVAANYDAKGGKLSHNTATGKIMSGDPYSDDEDNLSYFYIDSYIDQNARADADVAHHGANILNNDLFQFTTQANGTVKAVEVSGHNNEGYENLYHTRAAVNKNTQVYVSGAYTLVVNSNTVFLVRSGAGTTAKPYTFKSVTGFTNVESYVEDEVDYVDTNKDGIAEYVYVSADSAASKVTSLFYYDGAQGAYALGDGTWALPGYIDGVAGSIVFENYAALNHTLKASASGTAGAPVANTLYKVALEDNVVKQGYAVADNEDLSRFDADHELAKVYTDYTKVTVATVTGNTSDVFDGEVYTDKGATVAANVYYSVVNDVTKTVGTMNPVSEKEYYFVFVNTGAEQNRLALQAYAYDQDSTVPDNDTKTYEVVATNGNTISAAIDSNNLVVSNAKVVRSVNGAAAANFDYGTADVTVTVKNADTGVVLGTLTGTVTGSGNGNCLAAISVPFALAHGNYKVDVTMSNDTIGTLNVITDALVGF